MNIKIKCNNCEELINLSLDKDDFQWEIVDTDEREMGIETHYQFEHEFTCENCDQDIKLTFDIWEYPQGFYNDQDITVDGGEVVDDSDFDLYTLSPINKNEEDDED